MNVPAHIAIIMDGNGRWAKERGQIRLKGHQAGMEALHDIVKACSDMGVQVLTVYAFSTENWKRPAEEVSGIFSLLVRYVAKELKELNENNVRIRLLGDVRPLPDAARKAVMEAVDDTADNTGLVFNIAINYGGRAEIVHAVRMLVESGVKPEDVTEDAISERLYTCGQPDPDVIIRTAGEQRLSNFLLWQAAYSEFVFTPVLFPDFDDAAYTNCIKEYMGRTRRFGKVL